MDSTLKVRSIDSIYKDILRKRLLLVHKLQRKEGQWSNKQKFDLIDSVFRNIPLNPTYMIEEKGQVDFGITGKKTVMLNYVIDGVQRLSTIRDYIAGKFRISKSYDNMLGNLIIDGEEVNISGKKFSELDDWIKEYFLTRELQLYVLTNFSDAEVREMFKRQNAGSPLTNAQKNVVLLSDGLRTTIDSLSNHDFWKICKLSTTDFKKDAVRNIVLQSMWCISDFPITDFLAKESGGVYKDFVPWVEEDERYISISENLSECLDKLMQIPIFKDSNKKFNPLTKATIPAIIYGMNEILKGDGLIDKYNNIIIGFINNYDTDLWTWYRDELKDSIYQHKKVMDRLNLFGELANNTSYVDVIERRKAEAAELKKDVQEIIVDNTPGLYINESEEERAIREQVTKVDEYISDSELDLLGEQAAKKLGHL